MEISKVLLDLAIIIFATKALGMLMRKLGLPQVVGAVIAGLLIGPAIWGRFGWAPINPGGEEKFFLDGIAEIGVVMILFSAGLETDLKELKRTGAVSTLIAFAGVLVPMGLGFLVAVPFLGGFGGLNGVTALDAVFVGVILTATSVGITVETLKEMGKLKGKVGQTILSAAIIDDVIGIVVLSLVISFRDPNADALKTVIMTVLFFVCAVGVGVGMHFLFKWLSKKYDHHRRVPIFALVVCFLFAYAAEELFGIADITGAYVAGIVLSNSRDAGYIDRKVDINSYMIFSPVFFANIGIGASFDGFNGTVLVFALCFVAAGILGKILGCGGVARLCKFGWKDSAKIGVGMIARGEVALVVCKKGVEAGLFEGTGLNPVVAVILLVILSSLFAPIFLKLLYRGDADGGAGTPSEGDRNGDADGGGQENPSGEPPAEQPASPLPPSEADGALS